MRNAPPLIRVAARMSSCQASSSRDCAAPAMVPRPSSPPISACKGQLARQRVYRKSSCWGGNETSGQGDLEIAPTWAQQRHGLPPMAPYCSCCAARIVQFITVHLMFICCGWGIACITKHVA